MATPSKKHPGILRHLGLDKPRIRAIEADRCIDAPYGCGGPATEFTDELSKKEYTISGLCQECQDAIFDPKRKD